MIDVDLSLEAAARQHAEGCVKTWEDLDRYRAVINAVQPTVIVECGTFSGKSAAWFAREAKCKVITIDTTPHIDPDTRVLLDHFKVHQIMGNSTDPRVVERVADLSAKDYGFGHDFSYPTAEHQNIHHAVMVVLDSDHSAPHVEAEMKAYAPLVTPGSYMVVEDGLLRYMPDEERKHYTGDPLDAIEAWLEEHGDWEVDVDIEEMHPVSQFPSGWLRRK